MSIGCNRTALEMELLPDINDRHKVGCCEAFSDYLTCNDQLSGSSESTVIALVTSSPTSAFDASTFDRSIILEIESSIQRTVQQTPSSFSFPQAQLI